MPPAPVTPAMQAILQGLAKAQLRPGFVPLHEMSGAQARAAYAKGADVLEIPASPLERVQDMSFVNRSGQTIATRLYAASREVLPVLLFFHGGGFVVGSLQTHDILCRELARLSGCAVMAVDYRLAPEHVFPAAFEDAWDALQWLLSQGAALGLDTQRVAVGGDSAGGTIAATLAHLARNAQIALALQLLIYPGVSGGADAQRFISHDLFAQGHVLEVAHIRYFFDSTLCNKSASNWQFSPLNAPNFENLAPCWLALAECDPLFDEGLAYADMLRAAGQTVELEIYRGVTHEFIKMGRALPQARQFHLDAAAALKSALKSVKD